MKPTEHTIFYSFVGILCVTIFVTNFVVVPLLLQMAAYTSSIIYVGCHFSLLQNEIDPETGEKKISPDAISHKDAMMFPFIASAALLSLYLAFKFLPEYWVNLLISVYFCIIGCFALTKTIVSLLEPYLPPVLLKLCIDVKLPVIKYLHSLIAESDNPIHIEARFCDVVMFIISILLSVIWMTTKHWALHNIFASAFCIQAIAKIPIGNFTISSILLIGLFVYDIFWVFGTDVMVTVAKSFKAPAMLIFPLKLDPWEQSILGLGDVVIPGAFIALVLRFELWLTSQTPHAKDVQITENDKKKPDERVDIHQKFPKVYFWCQMCAYQLAMCVTVGIMFFFKHAQPALLYLVPANLLALNIPALIFGQIKQVYEFTEEPPTETPSAEKTNDKNKNLTGEGGDTKKDN